LAALSRLLLAAALVLLVGLLAALVLLVGLLVRLLATLVLLIRLLATTLLLRLALTGILIGIARIIHYSSPRGFQCSPAKLTPRNEKSSRRQ
jgi:hypothetical protein